MREPYAIVAGNPREIRKRFSDKQIAMLLGMAWGDWPAAALKDAMPLMTSDDVEGLHAWWKERGASARP